MRDGPPTIPRHERWTLIVLAGAAALIRALAYFRYRFDSDEPQHLHVAWGWTVGLVQYRDYFDNHAPLFHMASAPFLKALGERPDVLLYMRMLMIPLWAIVLVATFIVARRFWSVVVATWSTLLLALFPPFFLKSLEYRTDNAWTALWMVGLLLIALPPSVDEDRISSRSETTARKDGETRERPGTLASWFACGIVFGLALCVSMKTTLLIVSLLLAETATMLLLRERVNWRRRAGVSVVFLAGFVLPPFAVAAFFVSRGAWSNLVYCVISFNEMIATTHGTLLWKRLLYPVGLVLTYWIGKRLAPERPTLIDRTRFFLAMFTTMFAMTLGSFWVLISPRDMLPIMPLLAIFGSSGIAKRCASSGRTMVHAGFALLFLTSTVYYADWLRDGTSVQIGMIRQVLGLTRTDEPLMDLKGETIYRRRPYYYIFEMITREAILHGYLDDTVANDIIRARCHVVQADGTHFPPAGRAFMSANFLDVGRLRVAGQRIGVDGRFTLAVPGEYLVIDDRGPVSGILDGTPLRGPRLLSAGTHQFATRVGRTLVAFWAPAFARGYSPFHRRMED